MLYLLVNTVVMASQIVITVNIIALITVIAVAILSIISLIIWFSDPTWFPRRISIIKAARSRIFVRKAMGNKELQNAVKDAGFAYDWKQDIFYSTMNPWQRKYGYCRLYDELCPPNGMIVDSEPIYFYYGGKNWLIEFWKGQYDMTTGSEVGVYTKEGVPIDHPASAFYDCASDSDRLFISYVLKKNRRILFKREDNHWWLTGFMLGEFSEPSELTLEISITLKNQKMRDAFVEGLKNTGYTGREYYINGKTVNILFDKPHSKQPITRTPITDNITQKKNYILCREFVEITSLQEEISDKMKAVEEKAPHLLSHIKNIGKTRQLFDGIVREAQ